MRDFIVWHLYDEAIIAPINALEVREPSEIEVQEAGEATVGEREVLNVRILPYFQEKMMIQEDPTRLKKMMN